MKRSLIPAGILLLVICFFICPAQAFTAKSLDIAVQQNDDAVITFTYQLSWLENFAVFMHIADPGRSSRQHWRTIIKNPLMCLLPTRESRRSSCMALHQYRITMARSR